MKADRDASLDKLLASTLKASRPETPGDAHLDAETLAAWADDALDASKRASAEAHVAACARCQQLLAAMVRTLPEPEVPRSRWRMPSLAWLVPLTAAATALAIWVAVPRTSQVRVSSGEPAVEEASPSAATARALPQQPGEPAATESRETLRNEVQKQLPRQKSSLEVARRDSVDRVQPEGRSLDKDTKQESFGAKANAPALGDSAGNLARVAAPPTAAAAAAPAPAAPAAPPGAAQTMRTAPAEAGPRMEVAAAPSRMAFAAGLDVIVVSSNPATRFRLLPGGGVQRSADAGSTWRTEATGATETLRAGASPSPSVCWLVGGKGMVVLSIDGRTWRRVAFPETVDLSSVVAIDQDNATVTTTDGRAFVTADGGQTWTLRPGF
jgi:hypothetical protein